MKHLLLTFFIFCGGIALSAQQSALASSVEDLTIQQYDFRVFPNPATDYIQINDNRVVNSLVIYNLVGRKVKNYAYSQGEKFFVGDLPQGMYLVQILGKNNNVLSTKRINIR